MNHLVNTQAKSKASLSLKMSDKTLLSMCGLDKKEHFSQYALHATFLQALITSFLLT